MGGETCFLIFFLSFFFLPPVPPSFLLFSSQKVGATTGLSLDAIFYQVLYVTARTVERTVLKNYIFDVRRYSPGIIRVFLITISFIIGLNQLSGNV